MPDIKNFTQSVNPVLNVQSVCQSVVFVVNTCTLYLLTHSSLLSNNATSIRVMGAQFFITVLFVYVAWCGNSHGVELAIKVAILTACHSALL